MLKYRLIFGPLMIGGLLLILAVDNYLDQVDLRGTFVEDLFLGRAYLPAGLLLLLLFLVAITLATRELTVLCRAKQITTDLFMVWLAGILGCLLIYILPHQMQAQHTMGVYATVMVGLFVLSIVRHVWHRRTEGAIAAAAVVMFSFIYMGVLPGFFLAIRRWDSAWVIAAIILITKSCDIGAYFTGRAIGRHKLIPWLSPGKTWEGLIGGVLLSGLIATSLAWLSNHYDLAGSWRLIDGQRTYVHQVYPVGWSFLAGVLFGLVGQVGDLTASVFKRDAGIKDSGQSIPGFGGILDVVDSPILVAPLAYWMLVATTTLVPAP
jgi:phosphatidate cytidylyltransferase